MTLTDLGSLGTAFAVLVAAWQVRKGTFQARTDFEDDLTREYREIARGIPVRLHLGGEVSDEEFESAFPRLYQYIDLTNEQVFLRQAGRIGKATWVQWRDGIKSTLAQPAFARAWAEVQKETKDRFSELRRLERLGFDADPRSWATWRDRARHWWLSW